MDKFKTIITDPTTGEDTGVTFEKRGCSVDVTFAGEDYPRVVLEAWENTIRVLIYDDGVDEPRIYETDSISGSY